MNVYYGDLKDSRNLESTSYLQLNSCGSTVTLDTEYLVVRSGRSDYHIFYVTEGEAEVYGEDGATVRLFKGDFVLYPPRVPQKYKRLRGSKDCWIHFNGFQVPEILNDAHLSAGTNRGAESSSIKSLFSELLTEYSIKRSEAVNTEKGLLLTILYTLGGLASEKGISHGSSPIRRAVMYINENYEKSFSNLTLANLCNLSLGRFEHLFKLETGVSPSAYRQRLRIENAKSLLLSTALSVSEISFICGYTDSLYFSRIFKNQTGLPPVEYRRINTTAVISE